MGTISNYSGKIFLLKGLVSVLLIVTTIVQCRIQNAEFRIQKLKKGLRKISGILFLFISYLALTLTYSSNPAYGFQKILNFLISVVPSVIVFYYLISTITKLRVKLFVYSLGIISVLSVSYIFIVYPFDQSTIYEYRAGRWSHVIYGRLISSIAVVLLLYLSSRRDLIQVLLYSVVSSIAVYGTYLSAFRAGFIGVLLVGGGLLVVNVYSALHNSKVKVPNTAGRQKSKVTNLPYGLNYLTNFMTSTLLITSIKIVLPFIIAAVLIFTIPAKDIISLRFDNMTAIDNLQFKGDPAIHSRLDSWELSWVIIKEHPFIGTGFGGFSGYNNIEWTKMIKYPHNIILEMTSEGGGVGLIVLCSLFVVMFKSFYNFSKCHPELVSGSAILLLTFFLFALWLSMFSKEFSNQSLLWIGLAFYGMGREALGTQRTEIKMEE